MQAQAIAHVTRGFICKGNQTLSLLSLGFICLDFGFIPLPEDFVPTFVVPPQAPGRRTVFNVDKRPLNPAIASDTFNKNAVIYNKVPAFVRSKNSVLAQSKSLLVGNKDSKLTDVKGKLSKTEPSTSNKPDSDLINDPE